MRLAFLTTDSREHFKDYHLTAPSFGTAPEALLQGFARLPGVEVHVISCTQQPMQSPEKLVDNIFFHSVHVPRIGWLKTGYQGCVRTVRKKMRKLQPDLVHGQGTERDCAISAVFSGFPNLVTIHGNMRTIAAVARAKPFSFLWLAARLEQFTIPRSDGVVCISQHTRNAVMSLARRTWVVPNAVDSSFFEGGTCPESPPIILCVGSISHIKNQNTLIRALDPLAQQQKFVLKFLGRASENESYGKEFFTLLRDRSWCSHEGHVERDLLQRWLKRSALLVLPSREDNCPMAVLEAMAMGVPVVAANVGGIPELIDHGRTGLLCNPADPQSIHNCVAEILSNPQLAQDLSENAKLEARNRFQPVSVAKRHLEIYRELLSNRS